MQVLECTHDLPVPEDDQKNPDCTGCIISDAGYDADRSCTAVCNTSRNPVIRTCWNYTARIKSKSRKPGSRRKTLKSLKRHTVNVTYSGINILIIQVQVYCGRSRKETGNTKTAAAPQAHLLQPAVIVERRKKHVLCVWRVLYNPATFWYMMHRIVSCYGKILSHTGNQKQ